jgi:hypothetical protein
MWGPRCGAGWTAGGPVAASDGDTLNNGSMSGTVTMGGAPHSLAAPGAPMASSDGPSSTIRRSSVAAPVECVADQLPQVWRGGLPTMAVQQRKE